MKGSRRERKGAPICKTSDAFKDLFDLESENEKRYEILKRRKGGERKTESEKSFTCKQSNVGLRAEDFFISSVKAMSRMIPVRIVESIEYIGILHSFSFSSTSIHSKKRDLLLLWDDQIAYLCCPSPLPRFSYLQSPGLNTRNLSPHYSTSNL